ncbi:hypothetical protein [Infirmifilum lucidum]|nr:hypothetical protein [Infirmifilum lucidum]
MRAAVSSIIGYIAAAMFNSILLVIKETNKSVFDWLKATFGHHWLGHGILTIAVFVLVTLLAWYAIRRYEPTDRDIGRLAILVVVFTALSVIIIAGFYAIEVMGH